MSANCTKWAYAFQIAEQIAPTAHHVLLCLADRYNEKYAAAWPGYPDICGRTGLSKRSVARALDELERLGVIQRNPRLSSHGRKIGTIYRFPLYDANWVAERTEADFDEHGKYHKERAAENREYLPDIYEPEAAQHGGGVVRFARG